MNRLTRRMCGGWGLVEGCELNTPGGMRRVIERLAAYENAGITPEVAAMYAKYHNNRGSVIPDLDELAAFRKAQAEGRIAAEYNWHLRNGELGKCGKDQFLMAAALREEGRRVDELKALMLSFFFGLNGVDSGPAINRSTSKRAAEAFAASGMSFHEMEELYTDTIRQDTVPRPVVLVKDSLYVFEICLEGMFEEADAILVRFMEAPTKR